MITYINRHHLQDFLTFYYQQWPHISEAIDRNNMHLSIELELDEKREDMQEEEE